LLPLKREWDKRRHTFSLRLNKPDEIEILPSAHNDRGEAAVDDGHEEDAEGDPALAAIHVGRRVPVYRKLGDTRPKQLRVIMHRVVMELTDDSIPETLPGERGASAY
jgi:hypothetical protein